MSKLMVKDGDIWVPMEGLKGDTGPLPADNSVTNDALVTDGAKTNTAYLMGNRLTKDAEGEFISVDDSYPSAALSLTVDGKSTQLTTTGKNLFNNADLSRVGYYEYSTGEYRNSKSFHWFTIPVTAGDIVRHSDITNCRWSFWGEGAYISGSADWVATAPEGADEARGFWSGSSNKGIATKNNADLTYEPYSGGAASPRPDWPQEIVSIDDPSVKITAKNLLGGDDFQRNLSEDSAITFDEDEHGRYARWSAGDSSINLVKGVHFKENTSYTFIFAVNCTRKARPWNITGYYTDQVSIDLKPVEAFDGTTIQVFAITTSASKTVEGIYRVNNGGATYLYYDYCGVFEGAITVDDYAAYLGHTAQLLSDEPLRSLPDGTKDELHLTYIRPSTREGWAFYRGEKVKRVELLNLAELSWAMYRGTCFDSSVISSMRSATNSAHEITSNMFSSYGSVTLAWFNGHAQANKIASNVGSKRILVKTGIAYESAADFKATLDDAIAMYPLATPETIDLGIFELPAMQSGTTHLWSDPSTNLSVTYERDKNIVITNLKAAVADLATS